MSYSEVVSILAIGITIGSVLTHVCHYWLLTRR